MFAQILEPQAMITRIAEASGLPFSVIRSTPDVMPSCGPMRENINSLIARRTREQQQAPTRSATRTGSPLSQWQAEVEAEVANGATRMQAVKNVDKRRPGLREQMLDQFNR